MEWVETTGRTVEEAKDAALDQLGVDEEDAEFEILEEPKLGLFGRLRAEARVRARVRPTTPRPKEDRGRRRRRPAGEPAPVPGAPPSDMDPATQAPGSTPTPRRNRSAASESTPSDGAETAVQSEDQSQRAAAGRSRRGRRGRTAPPAGNGQRERSEQDGDRQPAAASERMTDGGTVVDVSLDEQGSVAQEFLDGLMREMNLEAEITVVRPDEDTVEVNLEGSDLGLLIGPKGATLFALQDLTRTAVQRKTSASNGRLLVDVSRYRQKRKVALERFARQLAVEVNASGTRKVMEPMNAADRKVVHDAINDIEGVATTSEGEEPHRRVVILPTGS